MANYLQVMWPKSCGFKYTAARRGLGTAPQEFLNTGKSLLRPFIEGMIICNSLASIILIASFPGPAQLFVA